MVIVVVSVVLVGGWVLKSVVGVVDKFERCSRMAVFESLDR